MSFQLFKKDIIFYQRFLKSNGFYPHIIDGTWGPKTNKAEADLIRNRHKKSQKFFGNCLAFVQ